MHPPLYLKCCCYGKVIKYQGMKAQLCLCTHWVTASCHSYKYQRVFPYKHGFFHLSDHDYVYLDKAEFLLNIFYSDPQWKFQRVNKQKNFKHENNLQLGKFFVSFKVWMTLVHYLSVFPKHYGDDLNDLLGYFDVYFSRCMNVVLGQRGKYFVCCLSLTGNSFFFFWLIGNYLCNRKSNTTYRASPRVWHTVAGTLFCVSHWHYI